MDTYQFPKHPDTELTASRQQDAEYYRQRFITYPPCAYGRFTFKKEPADLDAAVGAVRKCCNRISGERRRIWFWVAAERGGVNDRRHCHVFLFGDPKLTLKDYPIIRSHWLQGRIIGLSPFQKGGGAEWYMGWKMALGRERAWEMSKKLARRIGKLESAEDSPGPSPA